MIEHVHERLVRWADWVLSERRAKGLGYPGCTLARWSVPTSTFRADPNIDREAGETDDAVRALRADNARVIQIYYLGKGTAEQKAGDLLCSKATMFRWLEDAQLAFDVVLSERNFQRRCIAMMKESIR